MSKIFIIGNGFDIGHGLKTRYADFRKFLQENYPDADEAEETYPDVYQGKDGEMDCEDDVAVAVLMRLITASDNSKGLWSALEEELGRLDYSEIFDGLTDVTDHEGDVDLFKMAYQNEDMASNIQIIMQKFSDYFIEWIESIDYDKIVAKPKFSSLIGRNDIFINFNYTETLELIYKLKGIFHIHGCVGEKIIFGHGNKDDVSDYYMEHYIGAENIMLEIQEQLRKDTDEIIRNNSTLWKRIKDSDITDIYSYGFSFGNVDLVYIHKICQLLNTRGIVWYIHDYDRDKLLQYKQCLQDAGFQGKLRLFSTEK
jgi:hypothetical protein